jgi:hypothetical protein
MMSDLTNSNAPKGLPIEAEKDAQMPQHSYSERVRRVLEIITKGSLSGRGLRNLFDNATRDRNITEAEREAVISALETRIRTTSPRDAKKMFGPKDAEARALLIRILEAMKAEFDLSANAVGSGVKTGGDMISGEAHVSVYISYKGLNRHHATLGVLQRNPETDPVFVLRFYQTGRDVCEPDIREELPIDALEEASARYRSNLMRILGVQS